MAINLQEELNRRRAATDTFLAQRGRRLGDYTQPIEQKRNSFFQNVVNPRIGSANVNVGDATQSAIGREQTKLSRNLGRTLSQQDLQRNLQRLDLVYNNTLQRAKEAGLNNTQAIAYAREQSLTEADRIFKSQGAERERQSSERMGGLKSNAAYQSRLLDQEFEPKSQYEQAMVRSLFGLGTSLATAGALGAFSNKSSRNTPSTFTRSQYPLKSPSEYGQGYYPSAFDNS